MRVAPLKYCGDWVLINQIAVDTLKHGNNMESLTERGSSYGCRGSVYGDTGNTSHIQTSTK